jgi:hypothetical protein
MDSSAFFQYPSGRATSAGNARFLGDLRNDGVRVVLRYTQARRYDPGVAAIREGDTPKDVATVVLRSIAQDPVVVGEGVPHPSSRVVLLQGDRVL